MNKPLKWVVVIAVCFAINIAVRVMLDRWNIDGYSWLPLVATLFWTMPATVWARKEDTT